MYKQGNITTYFIFIILLNLASCGGGGSTTSNEGSKPAPPIPKNMTLSAKKDEANIIIGTVPAWGTIIRINVSAEVKNKIGQTGHVYFIVTHTNQDFEVKAEIIDDYGLVLVRTDKASQFALGSYIDDITIQGCYDSLCAESFGKEVFTYQLNVRPKPILSSTELSTEIDKNAPDISSSIQIDFGEEYLKNDQWHYKIYYTGAQQDWLTVSQSTEANLGKLEFKFDDSILCGNYSATLVVTAESHAGGDNFAIYRHDFPINFTLTSSTPSIFSLAPSTHYVGQPIYFTIRGCGLDAFESNAVKLNNLQVQSQTYRNSFELEVIAEPISSSGKVEIELGSSSDESKYITLVDKHTTNLQIADDLSDSDSNISRRYYTPLFDDKNQILYVYLVSHDENRVNWERILIEDGKWILKNDLPFDDVRSMDISPDGNILILTYYDRVEFVDSTTYELVDVFPNNSENIDAFKSGKILNNGQVLMGVDAYGTGTHHITILDLASRNFKDIHSREHSKSSIITGPDKSKGYVDIYNYGLWVYNSLAGTLEDTSLYAPNSISISKNGHRLMMPSNNHPKTWELFNDEQASLAVLPRYLAEEYSENIVAAIMTADAATAYAVYKQNPYSPNFLVTYDLTQINPEGHPKKMSVKEFADLLTASEMTLALSGDGETLFILGNRVLAMPVDGK